MRCRKLLALLLAACAVLSLAACGGDGDTALPQLVIGYTAFEPYSYADADGDPAGSDVDLAQEACRRMGYEPVFQQIDWSERDALLHSGKIDCLWSCFAIDGQELQYAWVGPYMRSRQVVAVLDNSSLHSLRDLEGMRVCVRAGSKGESIFLGQTGEEIPAVKNVYSLNNVGDMATALHAGYVDAIAGYASATRQVLLNSGISFRFLEEELSWASLGVAFSKNSDPELRAKLADTLDEMLEDGTTKVILQQYGVDTDKTLSGLYEQPRTRRSQQ